MQVDILIVNCSLFNPTPSLSAMIVNHFKMKSSIVSYNLSGMGCSAGVISISLAKELLQVGPARWTDESPKTQRTPLLIICSFCCTTLCTAFPAHFLPEDARHAMPVAKSCSGSMAPQTALGTSTLGQM